MPIYMVGIKRCNSYLKSGNSRRETLRVDAAHVMEDGVIVRNGGAELVEAINEKGFGGLKDD